MLLRSERITLRCRGSTDALAEALRAASAEWRESKLGAAGRGIGIVGWKVRVRDDRIVVRPQIGGAKASGFIPHFVGRVSVRPLDDKTQLDYPGGRVEGIPRASM